MSEQEIKEQIQTLVDQIVEKYGYRDQDIFRAWRYRHGGYQRQLDENAFAETLEWIKKIWHDEFEIPAPGLRHLRLTSGGMHGTWRGECPNCHRTVALKSEYDQSADTDKRSKCRFCKHIEQYHFLSIYSCKCDECQLAERKAAEIQKNFEFMGRK